MHVVKLFRIGLTTALLMHCFDVVLVVVVFLCGADDASLILVVLVRRLRCIVICFLGGPGPKNTSEKVSLFRSKAVSHF